MTDSKLPVKIRMGIRDNWDNPKCELRQTISALGGILGTTVDVAADWKLLWNILEPQFPDPTTFIPAVEAAVRYWAESLRDRLDSADFESWTDEFLEKVGGGGLRVDLGISEDGLGRPETSWSKDTGRVSILLPSTFGPTAAGEMSLRAGYSQDLETLFHKKSAPSIPTATSTANIPTNPPVDEDGWADLAPRPAPVAPVAAASVSVGRTVAPVSTVPEKLPNIMSIARPEILFETEVPYFITVKKYGDKVVHIESSHQGSLNLIAEYFTKWRRQDRNYHGDVVEITKQNTMFGMNAGFDQVKIECTRWHLLNPTPFLAFIEVVLKYQLVESTHGTWFYRRDVKFV